MKKTGFLKATAQTFARQHKRGIGLFFAALLVVVYAAPTATALTHYTVSLALSDSRPYNSTTNVGSGVKYTYTASNVSTSSIKCMKFQFSTTVAGAVVPTGMVTTAAAMDTTGATTYVPTPGTGWTTNSPGNGTVTVTNSSGQVPASASNRVVVLNNITNSTTADTTYFLKFNTYDNTDCSSSPVDSSVVAFIITNGTAVTMSVDPTLTFTVAGTTSGTTCNSSPASTVTTTGTTVPFGSVSASANAIGVQNLSTTTNAGTGYAVSARYTGQLSRGTGTDIANHGGNNSAPTAFSAAGTEAYGYTTNDATLSASPTATRFTATGGNKWAAFSTTNAEVAYSATGVSADPVCVGHQVGVANTTAAGSYTTAVIYTATPIY